MQRRLQNGKEKRTDYHPTDLDMVKETQNIMDEWGADAIRDCDGTEFPQELKDTGAKIYATYYTTRKDNAWAKENPDEIQQMYICSQLVKTLRELENNGCISAGKQILVIPTINAYSVNISRRFFGVKEADINRSFPGNDYGEPADV